MPTRSRHNSRHDTMQLAEKAGEVGDGIRDMASLAVDAGREQLNRVKDAATGRFNDAKEQVGTWEAGLEDYVRERPIKSLLIAAFAGMVIARFWRRS